MSTKKVVPQVIAIARFVEIGYDICSQTLMYCLLLLITVIGEVL